MTRNNQRPSSSRVMPTRAAMSRPSTPFSRSSRRIELRPVTANIRNITPRPAAKNEIDGRLPGPAERVDHLAPAEARRHCRRRRRSRMSASSSAALACTQTAHQLGGQGVGAVRVQLHLPASGAAVRGSPAADPPAGPAPRRPGPPARPRAPPRVARVLRRTTSRPGLRGQPIGEPRGERRSRLRDDDASSPPGPTRCPSARRPRRRRRRRRSGKHEREHQRHAIAQQVEQADPQDRGDHSRRSLPVSCMKTSASGRRGARRGARRDTRPGGPPREAAAAPGPRRRAWPPPWIRRSRRPPRSCPGAALPSTSSVRAAWSPTVSRTSSSTVPDAIDRPRSMMTRRSQVASTSPNSWVLCSSAVPSLRSSSSMARIRSRAWGSTPTVGSSSSSTRGR